MGPIFPRNIQCTVLRNCILVTRRITRTGLSPSMAGHSRPLPLLLQGIGMRPYSTSTTPFGMVFGLSSSLFTRRYSGNPYWFLFLGVLGCFDSPGSPSHKGMVPEGTRKSHSETSGSKAPCAYPERFAAWHVLHRLSSQAIHQPA